MRYQTAYVKSCSAHNKDVRPSNGFWWSFLMALGLGWFSPPTLASGEAGVLSYSGAVSGKLIFDSSDCTPLPVNGSNIVTFNAPSRLKKYRTGNLQGGPLLRFVTVDYSVNFYPGNGQQFFAGAKQDKNVTWKNTGGIWTVTFNNARVPRFNAELEEEFVFLSGTLTCTNNLTKKNYEGKE